MNLRSLMNSVPAVLAASALFAASDTDAVVLVDDFMTLQEVDAAGAGNSSSSGPIGYNTGGFDQRFMEISIVGAADSGDGGDLRSTDASDNQLRFSLDSGVTATGEVLWSMAQETLNLAPGGEDQLRFEVTGVDLPTTLRWTATDGTTASAFVDVSLTNFLDIGIYSIPHASFVGVDFTMLESLKLDIDGTLTDLGLDLAIQFVDSTAVPEPGTYALLGSSLAFCAARRQKKVVA